MVRAHVCLEGLSDRLYTSETSEPPSIPNTDAFNMDPALPGNPPTFISPMYTNLWANTPRDLMTFAEKDFPEGTPEFPFRTQILQYLKEYGSQVKHLVEFNKQVTNVQNHGDKWQLSILDVRKPSDKEVVEVFDAVAVASGIVDMFFY